MSDQPSVVVTNTPGVIITQEVMYAELRATHDAVLGIQKDVEQLGDHEARLRSIERRQWIGSGAAAVVGSVAGIIGSRVIS